MLTSAWYNRNTNTEGWIIHTQQVKEILKKNHLSMIRCLSLISVQTLEWGKDREGPEGLLDEQTHTLSVEGVSWINSSDSVLSTPGAVWQSANLCLSAGNAQGVQGDCWAGVSHTFPHTLPSPPRPDPWGASRELHYHCSLLYPGEEGSFITTLCCVSAFKLFSCIMFCHHQYLCSEVTFLSRFSTLYGLSCKNTRARSSSAEHLF